MANYNAKRDEKQKFARDDSKIPNKEWLYQKYVIEKLEWNEFYKRYGISLHLLRMRLKEFGLTRPRIPWNKGLTKLDDERLNYERPTIFQDFGLTPLHRKIRKSARYRQWRKRVFERDDYICQICGKHGGKLNADHIKSFFRYPELRFDINNGRTLCEACHFTTENFGNKKYLAISDK